MSKTRQTEELADLLHSTAIRLLRLVRVRDTASGIAPARLSALSVLVFAGPLSLRDLARAEQVRPPTMSRIVDGLESQGLALRRRNAKDRRAVVIAATAKGTAVLKLGRKRRVTFLAAHLSRLGTAERRQIKGALQAIRRTLEQRQNRN
jgi:DNA-binding MarR family transcriptional regulator